MYWSPLHNNELGEHEGPPSIKRKDGKKWKGNEKRKDSRSLLGQGGVESSKPLPGLQHQMKENTKRKREGDRPQRISGALLSNGGAHFQGENGNML